MGSARHGASQRPACSARANGEAALALLSALMRRGLRQLVLCPGSRSAPLAVAAALLEPRGLLLHTAIDERSAAFFALGLGRATGCPAAVATTSGTAVAQLLAACVEADQGTVPLLLLTADRPARLKNCGANQAVPQEQFLLASCRRLLQGPPEGLAGCTADALETLAAAAMAAALGDGWSRPPGPVHLNLPFEEPIHAGSAELVALERFAAALPGDAMSVSAAALTAAAAEAPQAAPAPDPRPRNTQLPGPAPQASAEPPGLERSETIPHGDLAAVPRLDPDRPGVVVAGPWRGTPQQWPAFCQALIRWQRRSGWPVLADALSGLRGLPDLRLITAYDLLLEHPPAALAVDQVLRLGSLPASRRLERWLLACGGNQVLVSQGDPRRLDPLATVPPQRQWSGGLPSWLAGQGIGASAAEDAAAPPAQAQRWDAAEAAVQRLLDQQLTGEPQAPSRRWSSLGSGSAERSSNTLAPAAEAEGLSEPWLARALSLLLPPDLPVMLASSSPVRDWESFADPLSPWRPIFGFRGASGIDGTLSIACGLAEALGHLVLVSGDLALLHDSNGWLWHRRLRGRLTVVLIENGGGGIFEQLPIRPDPAELLDFERLFAMPQAIDQLALAALHGVPGRRVRRCEDLPDALAWALAKPFALLEVRSHRGHDAALRRRLRLAAARENGDPDRQAP